MGWITMSLRRCELQASVKDLQMELLQISRQRRELSRLSQAMGDGRITPAEIGSLGGSAFNDALQFTELSSMVAGEMATMQRDEYASLYESVTAEQYYNNPALAAQATLYFNEDGSLNTDAMYSELYEQALEDYVNDVIMPEINELEKDLENEQAEKETLLSQEEAELDSLKQSISEDISKSTIQL
ncbi:hypothetical protein IJX73_06295 [bacterium]|nr:hypothetical protein [bacterium]